MGQASKKARHVAWDFPFVTDEERTVKALRQQLEASIKKNIELSREIEFFKRHPRMLVKENLEKYMKEVKQCVELEIADERKRFQKELDASKKEAEKLAKEKTAAQEKLRKQSSSGVTKKKRLLAEEVKTLEAYRDDLRKYVEDMHSRAQRRHSAWYSAPPQVLGLTTASVPIQADQDSFYRATQAQLDDMATASPVVQIEAADSVHGISPDDDLARNGKESLINSSSRNDQWQQPQQQPWNPPPSRQQLTHPRRIQNPNFSHQPTVQQLGSHAESIHQRVAVRGHGFRGLNENEEAPTGDCQQGGNTKQCTYEPIGESLVSSSTRKRSSSQDLLSQPWDSTYVPVDYFNFVTTSLEDLDKLLQPEMTNGSDLHCSTRHASSTHPGCPWFRSNEAQGLV